MNRADERVAFLAWRCRTTFRLLDAKDKDTYLARYCRYQDAWQALIAAVGGSPMVAGRILDVAGKRCRQVMFLACGHRMVMYQDRHVLDDYSSTYRAGGWVYCRRCEERPRRLIKRVRIDGHDVVSRLVKLTCGHDRRIDLRADAEVLPMGPHRCDTCGDGSRMTRFLIAD